MKGVSGFLVGVIVGMLAMFGLVRLGYVHMVSEPPPVVFQATPGPASAPTGAAAEPGVTAAPTGEVAATPTPAPPTPAPTASPSVAGAAYRWSGPHAAITYAFHGDGTYDATYNGSEGDAGVVGFSKGTWILDGSQLSTRETLGTTRRTANGVTTTRPEGAGDVTFTVGAHGTLTDGKGRIYRRL